MGNLCSKSSNETESFAQPGRVLGGGASQSQPASSRAAAPAQKATSSTPGRSLGGRDGASSPDDARRAAAKAAEERAAKASKSSGKLSAQLEAQKKQTRNQVLNAGSEQERRARDADAAAEARNYN